MMIQHANEWYAVQYRDDDEGNVIAEAIGPLAMSHFGGARGVVVAAIGRTRPEALSNLRRALVAPSATRP